MNLQMFGHLMGKFYLRTDQEILTFFMINQNLGGNGQRLHYGKRNEKGREKLLLFFLIFMGWVSCFYFCNNSLFITGNAPLILKIFNNKTHVILFLLRKLLFIDFSELHLSSQFSLIALFLSLLRES